MKSSFTLAAHDFFLFHAKVQVSEVNERQVKLGETLTALIERGGYARNRKEILAALEISSAALSQYARDQTRPSFQKLVALADFFGVSIDYLVYGEVAEPASDYAPVARHVDQSLARVMLETRRHTALVGRIGRVLSERIDDVARELASFPAAGREGLIQDHEIARVERCCSSVRILTLHLKDDLIIMPDGEPAAGEFLEVVAANLLHGCDYQFMVPLGSEKMVQQFRGLLADRVGLDLVRTTCSFRRTGQPVIAGTGLYQLDLTEMRSREPDLLERMGDHIGPAGEFGYLISPNRESNSDMVMNQEHRERAQSAFTALWSAAKPV